MKRTPAAIERDEDDDKRRNRQDEKEEEEQEERMRGESGKQTCTTEEVLHLWSQGVEREGRSD